MKLYIDSREHKRIPYAKNKCKGWNWEYEIKQLPVGDYVCGNTVIEYKTGMDFISSVYDGRLKKESIKQANSFPNHFILIVGDISLSCKQYQYYTKRNFSTISFMKSIASLVQYTQVLMVRNQQEAFNLMHEIFIKCNEENKRVVVPVDKLSDNPCYNFIASIPRIGSTRAENIVAEMNLKKGKDLLKLEKDDLLRCKGIGDGLADVILDAIK